MTGTYGVIITMTTVKGEPLGPLFAGAVVTMDGARMQGQTAGQSDQRPRNWKPMHPAPKVQAASWWPFRSEV